jgi:DNA recombination protein RmuC
MQNIESEGRTVAEAVEAALRQHGLRREQVEVTVLEPGSSGFIGIGAKLAKVRLTEKRMVEATDAAEKERHEKAFVNDIKMRIQETAKYIRPSEDTTDFAFMFIPHEAIYYDLLVNKVGAGDASSENLIQRAAGKYRVIIVSPTSFLAYLQTVLQGLKAMHIEESAKKIRSQVEDLGRHIAKWEEYYKKLGATLGTTVSHYNAGYKELGKIDKDVVKISGSDASISPLSLDKPQEE